MVDTPFYQTFILHASFEGIHVDCTIIIAIPFSRLGFLVRDFRVLNLLSSFSRIFFFTLPTVYTSFLFQETTSSGFVS